MEATVSIFFTVNPIIKKVHKYFRWSCTGEIGKKINESTKANETALIDKK